MVVLKALPEAKALKKLPIQTGPRSLPATQSDINRLEIADGLKQLLLSNGYDLNSLLQAEPESLAQQLGIDEYIAKLVTKAAKAFSQK